jgi:hypothetical protein
MKKKYKEFVINSLYGLIEGSPKSLQEHMIKYFFDRFERKAEKITVVESKFRISQEKNGSWIGAMLATITIDGESFSYERDFGEEYDHDILHPDYETDDWFYDGDKCYANFKLNEALNNI